MEVIVEVNEVGSESSLVLYSDRNDRDERADSDIVQEYKSDLIRDSGMIRNGILKLSVREFNQLMQSQQSHHKIFPKDVKVDLSFHSPKHSYSSSAHQSLQKRSQSFEQYREKRQSSSDNGKDFDFLFSNPIPEQHNHHNHPIINKIHSLIHKVQDGIHRRMSSMRSDSMTHLNSIQNISSLRMISVQIPALQLETVGRSLSQDIFSVMHNGARYVVTNVIHIVASFQLSCLANGILPKKQDSTILFKQLLCADRYLRRMMEVREEYVMKKLESKRGFGLELASSQPRRKLRCHAIEKILKRILKLRGAFEEQSDDNAFLDLAQDVMDLYDLVMQDISVYSSEGVSYLMDTFPNRIELQWIERYLYNGFLMKVDSDIDPLDIIGECLAWSVQRNELGMLLQKVIPPNASPKLSSRLIRAANTHAKNWKTSASLLYRNHNQSNFPKRILSDTHLLSQSLWWIE
eukprot:CAMPEP_0182441656 /NCGR_PEP_ID=MMETSP1172-20130603/644_1 /TAXON_ID=708627 /ORGANISM="Timspurckia oligopyrenoides, Strain CCMP3278" /LENGTH=461 /DNA_ID=CAMNT_0024636097 /DNA_START=1822 /DNA_END=3207 /DNA_ORIENTATION=+